MTRSPSFAGVVLAAGASSRMGADKALLPWRGRTFLTAALDLLTPATELVLVVAGANAPALAPYVYASSGFLVQNPEPERGQFSSLRAGLQEVLNRGRDAAIVTLVDRPPVWPATLATLVAAFLESVEAGMWAVAPEFRGAHGHPLLLGREMIEAMLRAPEASSAREVLHANANRVAHVPVEDELVIANIDTPEDYARICATLNS